MRETNHVRDIHDHIREYWDRDSETYDRSPAHAITDEVETATWRQALASALPVPPARILDAGAGTGALSILAAELGHDVTALDLSPGMLAHAREKASMRGLSLTFVVGSVSEPPTGPFDAVLERHVLWTLPDPASTLARWREVTSPGGRLVVFEGVWGRQDVITGAVRRAAAVVRSLAGVADDHHAPYPREVLDRLPLATLPSPEPVVRLVAEAGWRALRIARLRDVEWARRLQQPWPLGWLEHIPRYVLVAEA
jgi:ubiquinone/menaquinone biosynthesis C-methylase UbiE